MSNWITTSNNPKDWTEDFPHENGCYQNRCSLCKELFMGNKHRFICKECDMPEHNENVKKFLEDLSNKK